MKKVLFVVYLNLATSAILAAPSGKLLDKTAAVINDKVITYSQIQRIQNTVKQRRLVSPLTYQNESLSEKEVLDKILNTEVIRLALNELNYKISDEQVESSINQRQKSLGLSRQELITQLKSFNLDFNEYFEMIRESIEYNIFQSKIIKPLINITEQEIKNEYINKFKGNKTISFKYNFAIFSVNRGKLNQNQKQSLIDDLKNYRKTGNLPTHLSDIEIQNIEDVTSDSLNRKIGNSLKNTNEQEFSNIIIDGDSYKTFFVFKKEIINSTHFQETKNKIKGSLYMSNAQDIEKVWLERESSKYFVKRFI